MLWDRAELRANATRTVCGVWYCVYIYTGWRFYPVLDIGPGGHGLVVSDPLRMRKALGSIPLVRKCLWGVWRGF